MSNMCFLFFQGLVCDNYWRTLCVTFTSLSLLLLFFFFFSTCHTHPSTLHTFSLSLSNSYTLTFSYFLFLFLSFFLSFSLQPSFRTALFPCLLDFESPRWSPANTS